jgi:hypothetical protein
MRLDCFGAVHDPLENFTGIFEDKGRISRFYYEQPLNLQSDEESRSCGQIKQNWEFFQKIFGACGTLYKSKSMKVTSPVYTRKPGFLAKSFGKTEISYHICGRFLSRYIWAVAPPTCRRVSVRPAGGRTPQLMGAVLLP